MTTTIFAATVNAPQTFVVPAGVIELDVLIVGTSGGGTTTVGHPAGWGPILTGKLAVTPGETLTMELGRLGSATGTGATAYPDGGGGGQGPSFNKGGGGAGSTRIWRGGVGGTLLVLVAGGGGLGAFRNDSPTTALGNGLAPVGEPTIGTLGNGIGFNTAHTGGRPGSDIAGGAGGTGGTVNGNAGSSLLGANGIAGTGTNATTLIPSSGGGGGGIFGGGSGASGTSLAGSGRPGGQGGGGMSYIDLAEGWSDTLWDTTPAIWTSGANPARNGAIQFTYDLPTPGGWSLGLVSRLG